MLWTMGLPFWGPFASDFCRNVKVFVEGFPCRLLYEQFLPFGDCFNRRVGGETFLLRPGASDLLIAWTEARSCSIV
jgi:hypothetical protein